MGSLDRYLSLPVIRRRFGTLSIKPTVQLSWMSPEQQPQAAANDGPYDVENLLWPLHLVFVSLHACTRLGAKTPRFLFNIFA